ncbi:MAG: redoxin domain-containing protein [Armatimonadota bacterium]|nr:redoxin domain-containing protein [bacterium]MDW8320139.1 redoxin domain-containing protein [Armatimonadota bacterium]
MKRWQKVMAGMVVLTGMIVGVLWFTGNLFAEPLPQGQRAPDFTLPDQDGKQHRLSTYRGKTVVLAFYPADMTPGCTLEARSLRDKMTELKQMGVQVFGISVQDVKSKRAFCDKEGLNFSLLADVGGKVARQYGVLMPAGLAQRVTFIISPTGQIAQVITDVNVNAHGDQILALLQQKQGDPAPANWQAKIGQSIPDFRLPRADNGKMESVYGDRKQKATVVMFIATRCPVSNDYNERMRVIAQEYTPKGVRFVGINSNVIEPAQEVAAHAKQHGFPFPVLKDEGNKIADRFNAQFTPEIFVMDSKGVLRYHGRIDDSQNPANITSHDLRITLDALLAGKNPPRAETKAFGCTIKRVR